jgi:hypothetical protein
VNFSDKAKSIISVVAPLLGTALGGPLGGIAGLALAKALGTPPGDDKAAEAAIVGGGPDILLKLKQADTEFKEHMRQLDIDEEKLAFDDTASARARQIAVRDKTPAQLAWLLIGGFITSCAGLFYAIMAQPALVALIPQSGWLLIGTLTGYFANEAKQASGFYFGSSSSSEKKTDIIGDIAKQS